MSDALPSGHARRRVRMSRDGPGLRGVPPLILICFGLLAAAVVVAALAPLLAPYDQAQQDLLDRLQRPVFLGGSSDHLLGTDQLGRDVLSRLLFGLRTSLAIALFGMVIGAIVGTAAGLLAGTVGGLVEEGVMFLVDAQAAIPLTLLILAVVAVFGTDPLIFIVIVGLTSWEKYARVVRGEVNRLKAQSFIEAARALGVRPLRLSIRHFLPNIASPILVLATFNFSTIVLIESALSFLGAGIQSPNTSLGSLLGNARDYLITDWWLAAIPAFFIFALTMITSLIGDWLRDVLDPTV